MPTYSYNCKQCQMKFESFQSIVDPPLKKCPSCEGELERLITGGAGLIFKGSGFYVTDYAKKNSEEPKTDKNKKSNETQKSSESEKK